MTPQAPFLDPNNPLLASTPVSLETGSLDTSAGKVGVATFRSNTTTLTALMGEADARDWARIFTELADQLASKLVTPGAADVLRVNGTFAHAQAAGIGSHAPPSGGAG